MNMDFEHFVVFTAFGDGAPIAFKLKEEGKDVLLAVVSDVKDVFTEERPEEADRRLQNYEGVVEKADAWDALEALKHASDKDSYFLFFDLNCLWKFSQEALRHGFKYGNFFTKEDYELEADREKAKELVKKHYPGLKVAPVHEFKSVKDAVKFLEDPAQAESFFALKGDQDHGAKTLVPVIEDAEMARRQLIEQLERDASAYESGGFILEVKIPNPMEVTPSAWYMDGELVFMDVDVENKPIGAGNVGYQVGAAQTFICPLERKSELQRIAFPPFVERLARSRKGIFNIDASILIDRRDGSMYFGEFCTRPGYDSLFVEVAMSRSASGFFEDVCSGINPLIRDYGAGVRIFNLPCKAPYLYEGDDLKDVEVSWKTAEGLWPFDLKLKDGCKTTTGYSTDVCVATGFGRGPEDAISMAYDNAEQFGMVNAYFRGEDDFKGCYKTSIMERFGFIHGLTTSHYGISR